MDLSYVHYKDLGDLYHKFEVTFGSQNVLVYVWKSVDGLKRNTNFRGDYVGGYVAYPYRKRRGLFGEIHLLASRIDREYVSHEIGHLVYDWQGTLEEAPDKGERVATFAGQVTESIWRILENIQ